jgi:maleylpyruvate isomerase
VIAELSDASARRASLLPGWTVGHVLTHVARNADSHRRRAEAACRGEVIEQYPGGFPARAAEIDAGATRGAVELIDDVRSSGDAMDDAWRRVPAAAWINVTRDVSGRERPLNALPARRWQELEVHLLDLGLGVTQRDWSDDFVAASLPLLRSTVRQRLPEGAQLPKAGLLDDRDELAWLYGRLTRPDLPILGPWG